jgi:carboxypeptidase Taq
MDKDLPNWRRQLAKVSFKEAKQWLTKKIHSQGNLYDPADLLKRITGKELTVKPHLNYLTQKYSRLYGF